MVKYLILGFLISGLLSLENCLGSIPLAGTLVPDMALLLVLAYAARGQGKILIPVCFLCGWLRGVGFAEPAGFHILTFIVLGYLMLKVRSVFFIEQPLTQLTLCFLLGALYWLIQVGGQKAGFLPEMRFSAMVCRFNGIVSSSITAPILFPLYDRLRTLRRMLHP